MLDRRLKLGNFFGIGLYVHWTFALLVGYVALVARDGGVAGMAFGVAALLGVFFCVTLHEYGHALAARQFGIPTIDITLLPIGGVARLQRMPRIPWQELVVAVAGPAVNVVIASVLFLSMVVFRVELDPILAAAFDVSSTLLSEPSWLLFFVYMLMVNIVLVLFNMVPAFPMDGGRVLRSIMAMALKYRDATYIASRIGLLCALVMVVFAIQAGRPIMGLIAIFIAYAGIAESRQVDVMESVRGLSVSEAMVYCPETVMMDTPISEMAGRWQSVPSGALPVVSLHDTVVGVLRLSDVAKAIEKGIDPNTTAGQLADHTVGSIIIGEDLETVLPRVGGRGKQVPVVDHDGRLIGILDLDTMLARSSLAKYLAQHPAVNEHFDALS